MRPSKINRETPTPRNLKILKNFGLLKHRPRSVNRVFIRIQYIFHVKKKELELKTLDGKNKTE